MPVFCVPGLTTIRVLTRFSFSTGPPVILRQATATVTRVASFVAGLPNRNVKPLVPTGRTLSSVDPAPGLETPPLTAAYPGGTGDGEAGDRVRGQVVRGEDGRGEHDLVRLRARGSRDQHHAGRHERNDPPAHLPQSLAASLTHDRRRIEP